MKAQIDDDTDGIDGNFVRGQYDILVPHDGVTEWSVCAKCHTQIDWANIYDGRGSDDTSCPNCGHDDTAWLFCI